MKNRDKNKKVIVFKYPNATVRVHIPKLTDEERERNMKELKRSAEALLREVLKNEQNSE